MTIKLTKLPKTADDWSTYGFTGKDADYRIINKRSCWAVKVSAHDAPNKDSEEFNTLAEAKAFVEAYDDPALGMVNEHTRWEAAYDAASQVRAEKFNARMTSIDKKCQEFL